MSPPGLGQGGQGGHTGGVRVRPLEVEESVLEAVGGDLLGGDSPAGLHQAALPQLCQHASEAGALVGNDQLVQVHHDQVLHSPHVPARIVHICERDCDLTCTDSHSAPQTVPRS